MAKSYVPEGTFTACDKGTSPSQIRVTNNKNTTIYNQPMATEADFVPYFNIKPMGLCTSMAKIATSGPLCVPMTMMWTQPKDGVKINGQRMLLVEDSECPCMYGGKIKLFFDRPSAVSYGMGNGKMPSDYIKSGFDSAFENIEQRRAKRDEWLPDWMEPVAHTADWFDDFSTSLVEGAVNGVVGLGEVVYQVAQDPVGMGEAIGDMAQEGWDATKKGVTGAYDWARDGDNWSQAAGGAWDWASDGDNWSQAASDAWDSTKNAGKWVAENPRQMGNSIGEFIPDAVAAVYTGGGSLAATAGKKAAREVGEEVVEQAVKEAVEEAGEKVTKEVIEETTEKAGKQTAKEAVEEAAEQLAKDGPPGKVITKSADEIAEDIAKKQKKAIDDVENGNTKLEGYDGHKKGNHTRKSNYGEMKMDQFMKEQGYEPLHKQIDDIDQSIAKGIDGVYKHPGPPPKYAIGEAKYDTSTLSQGAKDGPQMSDDWIEGSDRLDKAVGKELADEIRDAELLNPGSVEKVLVHTDKAGKVTANTVETTTRVTKAGKTVPKTQPSSTNWP